MQQELIQQEQQLQLPYQFVRNSKSIRIKDYKIPVDSFSRDLKTRWGILSKRRQKKHKHFSEKA